MKLQLALHLILPMILQVCHLLLPLSPPISNSSCLFTQCQPACHLLCCTTVLLKLLYYNILNVYFCLFLYFICVKVLYSVILYSWLNKLDSQKCSWNRTNSYVGDLLYILFKFIWNVFHNIVGHKASLNKFKSIKIISSIFFNHNCMKLETKQEENKHMETEWHAIKNMIIKGSMIKSKRKSQTTLTQMKMETQLPKIYGI